MTGPFTALCTDFYVNQKLELRLDLPSSRDTILSLFDRVTRDFPSMNRFRRLDHELALESVEDEPDYSWMALRRTNIRSGWVNPTSLTDAYRLHRFVLDISPYYLSISPLDVEFVELVFGFDLEAQQNRSDVVFETLLGDSPMAQLIDRTQEPVLDAQPFLGFCLSEGCDVQAYIEVKTRTGAKEVASGQFATHPISIYATVRKYGGVQTLEDLQNSFGLLAGHAERLAEQRVIPHVLVPLRNAIIARPS